MKISVVYKWDMFSWSIHVGILADRQIMTFGFKMIRNIKYDK